tara:strand:+ start:1554 stop:1811 length:258 start_codon:yes stop_codon:yes gene_type:complete
MFDKSQIREHMEIIGADGVRVGVVDHLDDSGERIKLTKHDSPQTEGGKGASHHYLPIGLVAEAEGDTLRLSATGENAVNMFEEDQ